MQQVRGQIDEVISPWWPGEVKGPARVRRTRGMRRRQIRSAIYKFYNYDIRNHVSAVCSKDLGTKCFECESIDIPLRSTQSERNACLLTKNICIAIHSSRKKYTKYVMINGMTAYWYRSDTSLIHTDEYVNIESSRFRSIKIRFSGVGSENIEALR